MNPHLLLFSSFFLFLFSSSSLSISPLLLPLCLNFSNEILNLSCFSPVPLCRLLVYFLFQQTKIFFCLSPLLFCLLFLSFLHFSLNWLSLPPVLSSLLSSHLFSHCIPHLVVFHLRGPGSVHPSEPRRPSPPEDRSAAVTLKIFLTSCLPVSQKIFSVVSLNILFSLSIFTSAVCNDHMMMMMMMISLWHVIHVSSFRHLGRCENLSHRL